MAHDGNRGADKGATEVAALQSVRTERADSDPHNLTPAQSAPDEVSEPGELLGRARTRASWDFADEIERRWKQNQSCSRRLLAERYVQVDESTIRKWCSGDKPIPLAALELLPEDFAVALVRRIFARRGVKL